MGEWSLLQGTLQARELKRAGMKIPVSINVSRGQLADAMFAQALQAAIALAKIDPGLIELEFSESIFMDASEVTQANLHASHEIGVNLTIDNFGTGYSCLTKLKDIPAAKLKLGRAFSIAPPEDGRSWAVSRAMIQMGKDLGMEVIAEGVETKAQMEALKELSVDGIQGYYFALPMEVDVLSSWLAGREH
jgi:EAL domain-containing protein (putative c-di-GMP-specific phosphodiesterase class I)